MEIKNKNTDKKRTKIRNKILHDMKLTLEINDTSVDCIIKCYDSFWLVQKLQQGKLWDHGR